MTETPSVFINADTVKTVPEEDWGFIKRNQVRLKAYPIEYVHVPTGVVRRDVDADTTWTEILEPGWSGWIAVDGRGHPYPIPSGEARWDPRVLRDGDVAETLHWILNRAGDEWGRAGVITACALKWPESFEYVARHKVIVHSGADDSNVRVLEMEAEPRGN